MILTTVHASTLAAIVILIANPIRANAATPLDYPSAWQCDQPAFAWYCDPEEPLAPPPAPTAKPTLVPPTPPTKPPLPITDIQSAREFRERIEALQDRAIMAPTPDNVRAYIEAQEHAMKKGAEFSDVWRRVVWANPDLDYSQRRPVNATAVRAYDQDRITVEAGQLRELAKEHGLLFFFRSDCPYCHALAPTLLEFSRDTGFEILPISVDGGPLPGFAQFTTDRGQAERLGVTRVPTLYIASRKTGDLAPIGSGVISLTELSQRIVVLTATRPGEQY